jgi:hypothetical protein
MGVRAALRLRAASAGHDTSTTVERVSVDDTGTEGDGVSWGGSISDDGSWVAFVSDSTNFAPTGAAFFSGAYLRDLAAGTTSLVADRTSRKPWKPAAGTLMIRSVVQRDLLVPAGWPMGPGSRQWQEATMSIGSESQEE